MTPAEWKTVERELHHLCSRVELDCDGYRLTLRLMQISTFKNAINIYVDGAWKGEWITTDCEERRRFLCPNQEYVWKKSKRDALKKLGKRYLRRLRINPEEKYTIHYPWWTSFRRLKKHLETHNREIRLISPNQEAAA